MLDFLGVFTLYYSNLNNMVTIIGVVDPKKYHIYRVGL